MRKVWLVAQREYNAMVATKAFLLSIVLIPVLMFGGIFVMHRLRGVRDASDKTIVIVDGSGGVLFAALELAAERHNASPGGDAVSSDAAAVPTPKYLLRRLAADALSDADRLRLSDQVRLGEIEAFVEIPSGIMAGKDSVAPSIVGFHGHGAMLSTARQWVDKSLGEALATARLLESNVDQDTIGWAIAPVRVVPLGLFKKTDRGVEESRGNASVLMPLSAMLVMFMLIVVSAQPALESVMDEKASRIAELLLGSVNVFHLMLGKLLGTVAGSMTVAAIYAVSGFAVAAYNQWTGLIPWEMLPWFIVFQILAVLLFSSIFMAVGASFAQRNEAQAMTLPIWILATCPIFFASQIVLEPNGAVATWLSFFPPAAPLVMILRLASDAVIPWWQPIVAAVLLLMTTLVCVFLAARVFRVGILWQGKTPRARELVTWALRG
jgi:ABC-2 type transport system permease protein